MKVTEIKKCRICGNAKLIEIMNLGEQELSGKFPKIDEIDPPSSPLILVKCDDLKNPDACGLIQLKHSSEPEQMYVGGYGYLSGMNQTMTAHLKDVVKKIENLVKLQPGDLVIDIGSNDGTLLKSYIKNGIIKVGIDPGGKQYQQYYPPDIKLITDFFPTSVLQELYPDKKAKIITSIAMFYDLENPMAFIKSIKTHLHTNGIWVLEQSYLPSMLESNAFDTICHEHLEYYALKQIEWMLKRNDLKVINVERNLINGGSFKIYVSHSGAIYPVERDAINDMRSYEISLNLDTTEPYISFKNRVDDIKSDITTFLKYEKEQGKLIYAYGASTKGNILLNYFKLDNSIITAAAERNDKKWGCRTPGTHIPIVSEESARKALPEYFLVLPWHFKDEFIQRELEYLKDGGKFIFPLPVMTIVSWDNIKNMVKS
jgi:NDP-4-keto-2,6-dideoxyhexose 3-C-methyltransferase